MNLNNIFFFPVIIFSVLISISSYSLIIFWSALELMSIRFCFSIINIKSPATISAALKYGIIQTFASLILILAVSIKNDQLIIISMLIKIGSAPFHSWYPSVINSIFWKQCFILITVLKIPYIILLRNNCLDRERINFLILINSLVGTLGCFNQTQIRKLFAYRRIADSAWLFAAIGGSHVIIWCYFFSYVCHIFILINFFDKCGVYTPKDWSLLRKVNRLFFSRVLFSLAGLPPFIGFLIKILVLKITISLFRCFFLIINRVGLCYIYFSLISSIIISNSQSLIFSKLEFSRVIYSFIFFFIMCRIFIF